MNETKARREAVEASTSAKEAAATSKRDSQQAEKDARKAEDEKVQLTARNSKLERPLHLSKEREAKVREDTKKLEEAADAARLEAMRWKARCDEAEADGVLHSASVDEAVQSEESARKEKLGSEKSVNFWKTRAEACANELACTKVALQLAVPPNANIVWEQLTESGVRSARKRDVDFLSHLLGERVWRAEDIMKAMSNADLDEAAFETKEIWRHRIKWLRELLKHVNEEYWNAGMTAAVSIALNVSQRQMDELRNMTTRRYEGENDRHVARVLVTNPFNKKNEVLLPNVFSSRYRWLPHMAMLRSRLGTTVSEDGVVASRRLSDTVVSMWREDAARMPVGTGLSASQPLEIHLMMDGFPVTGFSLVHFCIYNCSLLKVYASQSEAELRCLSITRLPETTEALNRVYTECNFAADMDLPAGQTLTCSTCADDDASPSPSLHVSFTFAADKKGVEAHRVCSPSCPWCFCGRPQQHCLPWERGDSPPTTFAALLRLLRRVCAGIVTLAQIREAAHLLPPGSPCSLCHKVPFQSEAERDAKRALMNKLRASPTNSDKNNYDLIRRNHAVLHGNQHELKMSVVSIEMSNVVPELLHADSLNIAKLLFKHLLLRHTSNEARRKLTIFFKGLGYAIDLRKKDTGRVKADKWFRASAWDQLVQGTDSVPGGIAAWLPTACFIVLNCHQHTRESDQPSTSSGTSSAGSSRGRARAAPRAAPPPATVAPPPTEGGYFIYVEPGEADTDQNEDDKLMKDKYGAFMGGAIFTCLRGFDMYLQWHSAIREHPCPDTLEGRESLALKCAITAVDCMHYLEDGSNSTHRSWMMHIIVYIIPLFVRQYGNLWRFSSARLESRGARCKRVVRSVVSWQPSGVYKRTIKKRAHGAVSRLHRARQAAAGSSVTTTFSQKASSSGCMQALDRIVLQEDLVRNSAFKMRSAKRLANTGRLKAVRTTEKHTKLPAERIHLSLSCAESFMLMLRGEMPLVYDENGQLNAEFAATIADEADGGV